CETLVPPRNGFLLRRRDAPRFGGAPDEGSGHAAATRARQLATADMRALLDVHDPSSRQNLESFLAQRGWEVSGIQPGVDPAAEPVQLVVVQETPAGTGSAACRAIRAAADRSVYLVGIVWQHDEPAIRRLAAAGVDDVIATPLD